jgi:hypothetical protein
MTMTTMTMTTAAGMMGVTMGTTEETTVDG